MTTCKSVPQEETNARNLHIRHDEGKLTLATPRRNALIHKGVKMTQLFVAAIATFAALCVAGRAWADTETVDGIAWSYSISGGKAKLSSHCISSSTTGGITIPSVLGGCPVTSIGESAFYGCSGLTSVTIPSSVTSIGGSAFNNCSEIMEFFVDADNQVYASVNGLLLTKDGQTLVEGINGDVTIPSSVTSIAESAFYGRGGLTSLSIPSSVTNIAFAAFYGCSALGQGVVIIDHCVLCVDSNCPAKVILPKGVRLIAVGAFYYEKEIRGATRTLTLTSITIPSGVAHICDGAFEGCGLSTVYFCGRPPENLALLGLDPSVRLYYPYALTSEWATALESSSFQTTDSYDEPYTQGGEWFYYEVDDGVVLGSEECCDYAFYPEGDISHIEIPPVINGKSVVGIGMVAFCDWLGLTSVTIPSGVTSIDEYAFSGCCDLTIVTIPSSVVYIGDGAFYDCNALTTVFVERGDEIRVQNLLEESGYDTSSVEFMLIGDAKGIVQYQYYAVSQGIVIGNEFGAGTAIPSSSWGDLEIPSTIDGKSVVEVGVNAFDGCSALTTVTIPSNVTSIGMSAFAGCSNLTAVVFKGKPPEGLLDCCLSSSCTIHYPSAFYAEWRIAIDECGFINAIADIQWEFHEVEGGVIFDGVGGVKESEWEWGSDIHISQIPSEINGKAVLGISDYALWGCEGLSTLTIPSNVRYIGHGAFLASSLTSVTIPSSVTNIGEYAFAGCNSLSSATLSSGIKNIGEKTFQYCSSLTSMTIPSSVTNISMLAFCGCTGLTSVTIPSSVVRIDFLAFEGCWGLTRFHVAADNAVYSSGNGLLLAKDGQTIIMGVNGDVTIPSSVTVIGGSAFYGCRGLTSLTIPSSVTNIGTYAFVDCSALTTLRLTADSKDRILGLLEKSGLDTSGMTIEIVGGGSATIPVEVTGGKELVVEQSWVETDLVSRFGEGKAEAFTQKFGSDFSAAVLKATGKKDARGNDMFVWQDYVAGTDPTDETSQFKATVTMENGIPKVEYEPKLSETDAAKRIYTTYGKATLSDSAEGWTKIDADHPASDYHFFKVSVEMK